MNKKRVNTTFKTPLLNDCTNHLSFQLEKRHSDSSNIKKNNATNHEALVNDVVTAEFVRGYN